LFINILDVKFKKNEYNCGSGWTLISGLTHASLTKFKLNLVA